MSRIFMDGFESGNLGLWDSNTGMAINSSIAGRTGAYCVNSDSATLIKNITSISSVYVSCKVMVAGITSNGGVAFMNGTTLLGMLTLPLNPIFTAGTVVGTSSMMMNSNIWYLFEFYYLPHLTNGTLIFKMNGITVISITATKTATATLNVDNIRFICANSTQSYYDDIIIDDANWIGSSSIQGLVPTGAGTTTQFDPSTGNNYACVDEIPPSDTNYISTNTPNEIDTYACGNLTGTINSVKAVQVQARCMQEGSPAVPKIQLVTRPSSTDRVSASKDVQTFQPRTVSNLWELNPDDSAAWEAADVNGMEIGVKAVAS